MVRMVSENWLWGAERIRGELLKLGIRVSKRTIHCYMRRVRKPRPHGQTWSTFLHNHAQAIWACDFVQAHDLFFRAIFVFVMIEHHSRRVVHIGITRAPSDRWVAQQLKEATAFGVGPLYLLHDNDSKYGTQFSLIASSRGITELHIPPQSPNLNAICERFIGSLRRECLDHMLILNERQLHKLVNEYVLYFNQARPHQGIDQALPDPSQLHSTSNSGALKVNAHPVLGGLHHHYRRAA
jgi:transposase InsO family protein